jgi:RoxA-like, cytochrome c-like
MTRYTTAVLTVALSMAIGCSNSAKKGSDSPATPATPASDFRNGLTDDNRDQFYHLAEGSEVFPLAWLKSVKTFDQGKPGDLLMKDLGRFGFLPDPRNKDGLPVGLTAATTRGVTLLGRMVGLNCAACHVGELTYKGKTIRIDGAPNQFDTRLFFAALIQSTAATVQNPDELLAFLGRVEKERQTTGEDSPTLQAARKAIAQMATTEGTDLRKALRTHVEGLLKQPPADLAMFLKQGVTDQELRTHLLKGVDSKVLQDLKGLLDSEKIRKTSLSKLPKPADQEKALQSMAEEIVVTIRLLKARLDFLKRIAHIGKTGLTEWGPGRVDAFGSVRALFFDENYLPNAPVSYPHLWNFSQVPWFHYDGNTTSILERNLGQALGVGAIFEPQGFASTLRPVDSDQLEQLAWKIQPPAWPQDILGKIDAPKLARGKTLFKEHCSRCHNMVKAGDPIPDLLTDLKEVGTDPGRAESFAGLLPNNKPYVDALADVLNKIVKRSFTDNKIPPDQQKAFAHGRNVQWRAPKKYAARPLLSIWATAPYLHNGSVPTLYDLLLPAAKRPKTFPVGLREYDPDKLGLRTDLKGTFTFDTSLPGNSNAGHEFGTGLSEDDRRALLEYLKGS